MGTEQCYYEDPYRREMDVKVVAIEGNDVYLDRTICYPEGGGQSGDRGMIGNSHILDTQKGEDGMIVHRVDAPTFRVGDTVHLFLDWSWRYTFMKVHTAQHMISGILYSRYHIGTLSVHQGLSILTVECDREDVQESVCLGVEDDVNRAIREGHRIRYEKLTRSEALKRGLRRSLKVSGDDIRLVVVEGVDEIACGGLHVASTREVELVQYVGQEKIRSHARLLFRVSKSALEEIRASRILLGQLHALFSAQSDTLLDVARETYETCHALKSEVARLRKCIAQADWQNLPAGVLTLDISSKPYGIKDLAQAVDSAGSRALLAVKSEGDGFKWLIVLSGTYREFDFNLIRTRLLAPFSGKGGGRAPLYQGSASGDKGKFLALFREMFA